MTLRELSKEYKRNEEALRQRVKELQGALPSLDREERSRAEDRLRILTAMQREARELGALCERYYDRGYRRNGKYTL